MLVKSLCISLREESMQIDGESAIYRLQSRLRQAASIDKHLASFSLAPEQSGKIGIKKPAQKAWQKKRASRHQKKA